jgi:hypothetical protein
MTMPAIFAKAGFQSGPGRDVLDPCLRGDDVLERRAFQ